MIALAATVVALATPTWNDALVSWYGLYGSRTACGSVRYRGQLGVAHRSLPCGTKVRFIHRKRKITVRVIDRGPYVGGRTFDLTEETKNRLRCSDLCRVKWRIIARGGRH